VRQTRSRLRLAAVGGVVAALGSATAYAVIDYVDWGQERQTRLEAEADELFGGIGDPLDQTSDPVPGARGANAVALASGLSVTSVLTGNIANNAEGPNQNLLDNAGAAADMIAFWPTSRNPRWGIVCNEVDATSHRVPGVYRISLRGADKGQVQTILTGTRACDGIRRTPWNTIVATEERADGWAIEIYNPIQTTGVRFDRAAGTVEESEFSANVQPRPALGRFAWEGFEVLADGTVYAGDELSPSGGRAGGTIFKFTSSQQPANMSRATVRRLSNPANAAASPLAAGELRALSIGTYGERGNNVGQGNQYGLGSWVGPIANPSDVTTVPGVGQAREQGRTIGTGFWRPEDLHLDPIALDEDRVRFCFTVTGNSGFRNYGEVVCVEETPQGPEAQQFLTGSPIMNSFDNLDFQPRTGIVYVVEDTPDINGVEKPGDIWACLRDGADPDLLSDGCVRVISVRTEGAEPTGFIFDARGNRAYLHIQHSPDDPETPVNEGTYDELLVIDGWRAGTATAEPSLSEPWPPSTGTGTTPTGTTPTGTTPTGTTPTGTTPTGTTPTGTTP
jgi:hypothetical protein